MTHRAPLAVRRWPYQTTRFDATFEEIGARYGISYGELVSENPGTLELSSDTEHPVPRAGMVIYLPLPPSVMDHEWERYSVRAGTTLAEVARTRNDTAVRAAAIATAPRDRDPRTDYRSTGPRSSELTPEFLWEHVLNCHFRNRYLEDNVRHGSISADVPPEQLGDVRLRVDSFLMIPWPLRAIGRPIHAAPLIQYEARPFGNPTSCSTCVSVDDWVDELYLDHLIPMDELIRSLQRCNQDFSAGVMRYLQQLKHLHVAEILIRVMGEQPGAPNVDPLLDPLGELVRGLSDALDDHPTVRAVFPGLTSRRARIAAALWSKVQSHRFNELSERAYIEHDVVVNETETVRERICGIVADAYAQLSQVPEFEERVGEVIERALERHMSDGPAARSRINPVRGDNALETLMSLAASDVGLPSDTAARFLSAAAAIGAMGTTIVGNLPGPPSVAGAILQITGLRDLRHIHVVRPGMSLPFREPPHVTRRIRQLAAYAQLEESQLRADIMAARSLDDVEDIADRINGRFQSGRGWCSALAVVSLIGLVSTGLSMPDEPMSWSSVSSYVYYAQLASGGANTVSSVIGMFVRFGESGGWQRIAGALGHVSAAIMIVANAANAIYLIFVEDRVADGLFAAALSVGGAMVLFGGPAVALAGAVVIAGTTIAQVIFDMLQDLPESRRAVLALLEECKEQSLVARVLRHNGALRRRYEGFERLVRGSAAFVPVYVGLIDSTNVRQRLRDMRVSESVIEAFTTYLDPRSIALTGDPRAFGL
ncbi:hypothetical protein [Sorangium sp. So ce1335]|uniref:hypothetical protein n=1 Tax=Sorangium sp. So ce1335 TaxID=3133335 RepID=UPI003F6422D0